MTRTWSPQQEAIFNVFESGTGHTVLDARAGCGKTTTVIAGIERAPEQRILMAAFNKIIAEELKGRLKNPRAVAKTLHSLGFGFVTKMWGRVQVDEKRGKRIAAKVTRLKNPAYEIVMLIHKLAALGKNMAPFGTIADLVQIAYDFECIPENKGLQSGEENWTVEQIAHCAHEAMQLATEKDGFIDFDDMVYLPVRCKWTQQTYDLVVIDEAQDMNATQIILARAVCKGRIIVVGDFHQAIYGFRGADSGSMARLEVELSANKLGLTTTYRCPKKVVALAQKIVPDFNAADEAPEGIVRDIDSNMLVEQAQAGNFILSRKNAPLARVCLALLRLGKPAIIRGRDFGETLVRLVKKMEATTLPELNINIKNWAVNTINNLAAQDASDSAMDLVNDQAETIMYLTEGLASLDELFKRLDTLFSNNNMQTAVVCSSVHKAKGLEAETVFILTDTLYCGGKRHNEEESNIHYVSLTRTKHELVLVSGDRF